MPLQELRPPTLTGVRESIAAMERKYCSTDAFLTDAAVAATVDEDDAQEWRYLLMQMRAISQHPEDRIYANVCYQDMPDIALAALEDIGEA